VRLLELPRPFDLARTAAPVWWGGGRWPNVDWRDGSLYWVGREAGDVVWRCISQIDPTTLRLAGSADEARDRDWAARVLGVDDDLPRFTDGIVAALAQKHAGMRMWSAGSLYEGFVSSIVGQSISVASAAVTERRLYALFDPGLDLAGRRFWPAPLPEHLADAEPELTRTSGITRVRADALKEIGRAFSEAPALDALSQFGDARPLAESLLLVRGVGRWTIESALLWGVGVADAHPTGDVALLRAARALMPEVATLTDLDRRAEQWRPFRAWAARLLWIDLLGFPDNPW
jgi:3-methyladenine DNA glycosylase/8-oxoguanine DNA glycosylase